MLLIFLGVVFTQYFVSLHRATENSLANRWYLRGGQAMQAGLPEVAANDYRTALSYDPENREYRLRLAEALLAGNHLNEARAHLQSLWDEEPSNGEVNLTLARLYAKRGNFNSASRYYNNAINGVWEGDPRKERVAARFEFSNFLMQQQKTTQAQSELMALLADAPRETADQLRLGQMLLQVNEPEHTVEVANSILATDQANAEAWRQKGEALLVLNRYAEAERALANAVEQNPNLDDARRQLDVLREALRLDTSQRGLSRAERAERAVTSFQAAWKRLTSCATQQGITLTDGAAGGEPAPSNSAPETAANPLQLLYNSGVTKQKAVSEQNLEEDPDALDATVQYIFEVERTTAPICPTMGLTDQALRMLARNENK